MKIESVRIENFRAFKDETIFFDDYNCFVGANGAGKSTVFNALNIFFRQYKDSKTDLSKLSIQDFHHKDISKDIRITVTFINISKEAAEILSDYVRMGKLIITAVATYDPVTEKAEVKQFGNRLGFEQFRGFFEAEKSGAKATDLKAIYAGYRELYPDLKNANTKGDMADAIREYEGANPGKAQLIQSEDQFYGVTKGTNKLAPFIQWIFVPASKDAIEESEETKTSALGQLIARTVRSKVNFDEKVSNIKNTAKQLYEELLNKEHAVLDDISSALQNRLSAWAHPDIKAQLYWKQDPEKSVKIEEPWASIRFGERGFDGDLSRFGHGLQRSFMLALLQELTVATDENAPTLIMGIEEPELYQHPPQARHLAETLLELTDKGSQILLCTHSPLFIPGDNFDKIRIVREVGNPSYTSVRSVSYENLTKELQNVGERHFKHSGMVAKLYPSMNPITNEMFFCKKLILVEGHEDIAYIYSHLMLSEQMFEFRKNGCHIVPTGGKDKLIKQLAMAKLLEIPTYIIFDGDTNKVKDWEVTQHRKENKALLSLKGYSLESDWPSDHIIKADLTCWTTNLSQVVEDDFGEHWQGYRDKAFAHFDNANDLQKNPLAIGKVLELAWQDNVQSGTLNDLVTRILKFATNS